MNPSIVFATHIRNIFYIERHIFKYNYTKSNMLIISETKEHAMRIKESSRLITAVIVFLSIVGTVLLLYSYNLMDKQKETNVRLRLALEAINELISGSDILTAAIRNYAATGDKQYKNDFQMEVAVS